MHEDIDLFSNVKERYHLPKKPVRLIELFGGVGCQYMACKRVGMNLDNGKAYKLVEFDAKTVDCYNSMHDTSFTPTDITSIHGQDLEIVDRDRYCYCCCYSFPCQDLSLAGNRKLMGKDTGTRSGLLWEVERLLDECLELSKKDKRYGMPDVLIMENVAQVHGKGALEDFLKWQRKLTELGYDSYWNDCNSKEIGYPFPIAQNRNRCFMVSILKEGHDWYYEFPKKQELPTRLIDYLEDDVDEKYFLSDAMLEYITADNEKWTGNNDKSMVNKNIASTLNTREGSRRCDASNYIDEECDCEYDLKLLMNEQKS